MDTPPLFRRYPQLSNRLPWLSLGQWPTPVMRLDRLSSELRSEIWIKRDDLSGRPYGGNKVRKLEHLLGQAVNERCRSVVTVGGIGSNHVVATGAYASELGIKTHAVVVPQPVTGMVHHNLAMARALAVELVPCVARPLVPLAMAAARRRAPAPTLVIGPGGSSPMGTLGHISAALELREQIDAGLLPQPDEIYIALGSGGSMAGLVLGCALAELSSMVVGVRVVERILVNATLVRLLMLRTLSLLGLDLPRPRYRVVHGYVGRCYGDPTAAAEQARRMALDTEGLQLETTYTAKTLAAMVDRCRRQPGRTILFWNTYNSQDTSVLVQKGADLPLPARIERWLETRR